MRTSSRRILSFCVGTSFAVFMTACPVPTQYGGAIPIDESGLPSRIRQICRTMEARSTPAPCVSATVEPSGVGGTELWGSDHDSAAPDGGVQGVEDVAALPPDSGPGWVPWAEKSPQMRRARDGGSAGRQEASDFRRQP